MDLNLNRNFYSSLSFDFSLGMNFGSNSFKIMNSVV